MGKGQRLIPLLGCVDGSGGGDDGRGGDAGNASARPLTLVGVISKADLVNLLIHQPSRFPISFLEEKEQQRRQQQGKLAGKAGDHHSTEKPAKAKGAQEPTQSKSKVLRLRIPRIPPSWLTHPAALWSRWATAATCGIW